MTRPEPPDNDTVLSLFDGCPQCKRQSLTVIAFRSHPNFRGLLCPHCLWHIGPPGWTPSEADKHRMRALRNKAPIIP